MPSSRASRRLRLKISSLSIGLPPSEFAKFSYQKSTMAGGRCQGFLPSFLGIQAGAAEKNSRGPWGAALDGPAAERAALPRDEGEGRPGASAEGAGAAPAPGGAEKRPGPREFGAQAAVF